MQNQQDFTEALERLEQRHGYFVWRMPFGDVVTLVAQLQLALRHPANKGHSAERARAICNDVINTLQREEPKLGELLRMGFDPKHDVPTGDPVT